MTATILLTIAGLIGSLLAGRMLKSPLVTFALATGLLLGLTVSNGVNDMLVQKSATYTQVMSSDEPMPSSSGLPTGISGNNTMSGQVNLNDSLTPLSNMYSVLIPSVGGTPPEIPSHQDSS